MFSRKRCLLILIWFDLIGQAEGVTELTPKGFIDWCRNGSGYERKHLYDDKKLNEAVQVTITSGGPPVWSVYSCVEHL